MTRNSLSVGKMVAGAGRDMALVYQLSAQVLAGSNLFTPATAPTEAVTRRTRFFLKIVDN